MLSISNDCYIIGDSLCVIKTCTRDSTGELRPERHVSVILLYHMHCKGVCTASHYIHRYLVGSQQCVTTKLMHLMTAYYTPNGSFTANDVLAYKNKVVLLDYTLQCLFN